jgi:hypothetical protein
MDNDTPLFKLTVGEFLKLQELQNEQIKLLFSAKSSKYEYGIKGLAKTLGCSRSKASRIKASGILDEAIFQNGKMIIIDKDKALELFNKIKDKK